MESSQHTHRNAYRAFYPITTRWMDNDQYGHINNVTYYAYFDSAVNRYLINEGGLDPRNAAVIAYVVHSSCTYRSALAYPDDIEAGLMVKKLGTSSVCYGVGIFKKGEVEAAAYGEFVHVFVDRAANQSVPIPSAIRHSLEKLEVKQ